MNKKFSADKIGNEMEIIFLYDDLCQAKDEAWSNLMQALKETALKAEVKKVNVLEYAQKTLRYYPSPTILIDGEDAFKRSSTCLDSCMVG